MFKNMVPWGQAKEPEPTRSESSELTEFRANFDKLLDTFWSDSWNDPWNVGLGCDVTDSDNELVVRAEAPGFEPEEIDIKLSGNRLIVTAEHRTEEGGNGKNRSTQYGKLYRSMTVPSGIDADQIDATYKNGVLEIRLPKSEQANSKRVPVTK